MNDIHPANLSFNDTKIAFSGKSDKDLIRAYWLFKVINSNFLVKIGPPITNFAMAIGLPVSPVIRATIFKHFCGGESIEDCESTIKQLGIYNVGTILDYSVEGEEKDEAFESTTLEIIRTIQRARHDKNIPFSVFKVTGIARFALLEKLDAKERLSLDEQAEYNKIIERVERICRTAYESGVRIFVDAEESWIQDTIDHLALEMMKKYNRDKAIVYNTYQLYRWESLATMKDHHQKIAAAGAWLGAKLVRGAYMEKERKRAEENGYPSPIQPDKISTDRDYNEALKYGIQHISSFAFCAGTHNEDSCRLLIELMDESQLPANDQRVYFSQLLGMSDNLSFNLANAGYNVAKYVPYGPVKSVLPYLFRRANENTAIAGQMGRELGFIIQERRRRKKEVGGKKL
jgi:proline dehydrogenase